MSSRSFNTGPTFWLSLVLIVLGVLFLLDNLDILYIGDLWDFWPLILIGLGLAKLVNSNFKAIYAPSILIIVGFIFLLLELNVLYWHEIWQFWPVVLIIIGGRLLLNIRAERAEPGKRAGKISENRIDTVAVFGGKEQRVSADNFEGGNVTAIFGGAEVQFDDSKLSEGKNILDVFVMFGGAEIYVPADWKIIVKGFPIFGGFEDARKRTATSEEAAPEKSLIINGLAIFGGIEIKETSGK